MQTNRLRVHLVVCTAFAVLLCPPLPSHAQQVGGRALTLEQALRVGEAASEEVAIARAGVLRARGEARRARSEYFPQLFGSVGYTRTLESEFAGIGGGQADTTGAAPSEPCGSFSPDPALPLDQRVSALEAAVRCASNENPFAAFRDLPFGREHQYSFGLSLSQTVYSGGRVQAQNRIADAGRAAAEVALESSRAQLALTVTQAYYDALLSDRLLNIAEATLLQAETTLSQVQLGREVGEQPEFELLRARVTFETQRPVVIQRSAERTLAYMRLKQLLDLSLDEDVTLTSELDDDELVPVVALAGAVLDLPLDTAVEARAPVQQAREAVRVQEGLLRVARAQRLPALSLNSQFAKISYPDDMLPELSNLRTNWTVGANVQLPLFTGGRISGDEMVARADLDEAHARLEQTRQLSVVDTRDARERLAAAEAQWRASAGTVEQAARAYQIATVRFDEGISTQLELNDSRLVLQQAQANRAVAARDLQVARMRLALLPYLPLGAGAGDAAPRAAPTPFTPAQPPTPQRQATPLVQPAGGAGGAAQRSSGMGGRS